MLVSTATCFTADISTDLVNASPSITGRWVTSLRPRCRDRFVRATVIERVSLCSQRVRRGSIRVWGVLVLVVGKVGDAGRSRGGALLSPRVMPRERAAKIGKVTFTDKSTVQVLGGEYKQQTLTMRIQCTDLEGSSAIWLTPAHVIAPNFLPQVTPTSIQAVSCDRYNKGSRTRNRDATDAKCSMNQRPATSQVARPSHYANLTSSNRQALSCITAASSRAKLCRTTTFVNT